MEQQPVEQQDTVHPRNSKEDVEATGNRKVSKGPNFYSLEKEIALGKQLAQEVERSSKLIDDPVVTEYVNRIGQNLVRNSHARVPFTIKVIDSDEVNAFALPRGFFYVNSGLILRAQEESELAGVMAHEISHVTVRQKRRPGTIPKVFSTHPPTPERIENAQKEIARILPNQPEYIVTTSEFDNVKKRLRDIMFARKTQDNAPAKPSLRTRTEQKQKGQTQGTTDTTDDDRPTLKRRPDSP
jgi:predicted Zn-dependent protease